jgi:hypothetical protein
MRLPALMALVLVAFAPVAAWSDPHGGRGGSGGGGRAGGGPSGRGAMSGFHSGARGALGAPGPTGSRSGGGPRDFRRGGDVRSGGDVRRGGDFHRGDGFHGDRGFERHGFGHHHDGGRGAFLFFFAPPYGYGYGYPYPSYDYGPYDGGSYSYPDGEYEYRDNLEFPAFTPYYGPWEWSAENGYYTSRYHLSPRSWLLVIAYPGREKLAYFYDPIARTWVGVLDRSRGEFRRWYRDERRWSDPEPFPFAPPLPLDSARRRSDDR